MKARRVAFADFAVVQYSGVMDRLKKDSVQAEGFTDEKKFLQHIKTEKIDLCVLNMLLSGTGPFELIRTVRRTSANPDINITVISKQGHKLNIQNTLKAGANDFVVESIPSEDLYNRILYHLTPKKVIKHFGASVLSGVTKEVWPLLSIMLESTETLSRTESTSISKAFHGVLVEVAKVLGSNRTSLMIVDEESDVGIVLASSDDPKFCDFPVVLHKYPEVLDVVHSGSFVLIEDVSKNALTSNIGESVRSISIGSMMVFPIRYAGEVVGVLTVRRSKANDLPTMDSLAVLQALANSLAAHSNMKAGLRRIYKDFKPAGVG